MDVRDFAAAALIAGVRRSQSDDSGARPGQTVQSQRVIAGSATLPVGVAGRFRDRSAFRALAPTVIQVDELFGRAGVADNVELANRLLPRNLKCCSGGPECFPFGGIFCPPTTVREVFQRLGVFDEYVHKRSCYQTRRDCKHANGINPRF